MDELADDFSSIELVSGFDSSLFSEGVSSSGIANEVCLASFSRASFTKGRLTVSHNRARIINMPHNFSFALYISDAFIVFCVAKVKHKWPKIIAVHVKFHEF